MGLGPLLLEGANVVGVWSVQSGWLENTLSMISVQLWSGWPGLRGSQFVDL